MQGIPDFIKTPDDLKNLFKLSNSGGVSKQELASKVRALLGLQYHVVPILAQNGKKVVTRYFAEAEPEMATSEGLTVTKVVHVEGAPEEGAPEGSVSYETSEITLSASPPAGTETLSFYRENSILTQAGFKLGDINEILEELDNA